jgi:hypothetical protein
MAYLAELATVESPYERSSISARDLGFDLDIEVPLERWTAPGAQTTTEAAARFNTYGAVLLDPTLPLVGTNETVDSAVRPVIAATVAQLGEHIHNPEVVRPKNYSAYNNTARKMSTVSYPNVMTHFDNVVALQNELLPTVQAINGDPATAVSIDDDEGTVINLQLFKLDGNPTDRQQHGAHTDRVDTTVVVCLDNVGPNGDLVFALPIFNDNLAIILQWDASAITFRAHPVQPGSMVMIKSAEDAHFITAKTLANVQEGINAGHQPYELGDDGTIIGRTIINMAFESGYCRDIDEVAHEVESWIAQQPARSGLGFYALLNHALEAHGLNKKDRKAVFGAIVARNSAIDLYGDDPATAS